MATRVLYYGEDECQRLLVLRNAGYSIDECSSIFKLRLVFDSSTLPSAVLMTDAHPPAHREAISLVRAHPPTPLILFQSNCDSLDETEFDLVIPALTPTTEWLDNVAATIARSRALVANSMAVRQKSALLTKEIGNLREQLCFQRERLTRERAAAARHISPPPVPKPPRRGA